VSIHRFNTRDAGLAAFLIARTDARCAVLMDDYDRPVFAFAAAPAALREHIDRYFASARIRTAEYADATAALEELIRKARQHRAERDRRINQPRHTPTHH
jgi:hypothetical protein